VKCVSFRIPDKYYEKLEKMAREKGISVSELVRHMIIEVLNGGGK